MTANDVLLVSYIFVILFLIVTMYLARGGVKREKHR